MKQTNYINIVVIILIAVVLSGIGYWSYSKQQSSSMMQDQAAQEQSPAKAASPEKVLSADSGIDAALKEILASQELTSLNTLECSKVSDAALIKLGDAVMAPITGDEAHHSAMEDMMGGEESVAAKTMHSQMGKAYLGCSAGISTTADNNSGMNMNGMMTTIMNPDIMNLLTIKRNAALGDFLVDARGMTLYTFTNDSAGVSNCDGACATAWPPYTSAKKPADLSKLYQQLGTIVRKDGSFQFTWKGLPLYFFKSDMNAGDTNGEGVKGAWSVVHI